MNFYCNSSGEIFHVDAERIFQGSVGANAIRFIGAFPPSAQVLVAYQLPNGIITTPTLLTPISKLSQLQDGYGNPYSVWEGRIGAIPKVINGEFATDEYGETIYEIDTRIAANDGAVNVQFFVYGASNGAHTGRCLATARGSFTVERGVPADMPSYSNDYETLLNQILGVLANTQQAIANAEEAVNDAYNDINGVKGVLTNNELTGEKTITQAYGTRITADGINIIDGANTYLDKIKGASVYANGAWKHVVLSGIRSENSDSTQSDEWLLPEDIELGAFDELDIKNQRVTKCTYEAKSYSRPADNQITGGGTYYVKDADGNVIGAGRYAAVAWKGTAPFEGNISMFIASDVDFVSGAFGTINNPTKFDKDTYGGYYNKSGYIYVWYTKMGTDTAPARTEVRDIIWGTADDPKTLVLEIATTQTITNKSVFPFYKAFDGGTETIIQSNTEALPTITQRYFTDGTLNIPQINERVTGLENELPKIKQDVTGNEQQINQNIADIELLGDRVDELSNKVIKSVGFTVDSDYKIHLSITLDDGTTFAPTPIDLPLESVVVGGSYDRENKQLVLTLENGNTINIPVGNLVEGLASSYAMPDANTPSYSYLFSQCKQAFETIENKGVAFAEGQPILYASSEIVDNKTIYYLQYLAQNTNGNTVVKKIKSRGGGGSYSSTRSEFIVPEVVTVSADEFSSDNQKSIEKFIDLTKRFKNGEIAIRIELYGLYYGLVTGTAYAEENGVCTKAHWALVSCSWNGIKDDGVTLDSTQLNIFGLEYNDLEATGNGEFSFGQFNMSLEEIGGSVDVKDELINNDWTDEEKTEVCEAIGAMAKSGASVDGSMSIKATEIMLTELSGNNWIELYEDGLCLYGYVTVNDKEIATKEEIGDIETALDSILAIQNALIGGGV